MSVVPPPIDSAPDWSSASTPELCCPLCEYNLRGLVETRCPECGFVFTWSELIRALRERHPYLFEHHPDRNLWSFWKTYSNDWLPRYFWKRLNAAQPVRIKRLMLYWILTTLLLLIPYGWIFGVAFVNEYRNAQTIVTAPGMNIPSNSDLLIAAWDSTRDLLGQSALPWISGLVLVWPWLTFVFLLIFSESMRRAKIKIRHVLRAIVYGTDFNLLMLVPFYFAINQGTGGWVIFCCFVVTTYRLTFAYSRYLRFHLPFLTVLTSQILVMLLLAVVYMQLRNII